MKKVILIKKETPPSAGLARKADSHPDESDEAFNFMKHKVEDGLTPDEAISSWENSLQRLQAIRRWQESLLKAGKPTLHVSLFEAAKEKKAQRR